MELSGGRLMAIMSLGDADPGGLFGLGAKQDYVAQARSLIASARPGPWRSVNEVAYTDGRVTVVHVEHFRVQGAHLPNWLGENAHARARLGRLAREAVSGALACRRPEQGGCYSPARSPLA